MDTGPDGVQERPQCRDRRGLFEQQPVRLSVQGSGRIQNQRVHRRIEIAPEWLREFPVARHSAPERIHGDEIACFVRVEDFAQVSGPQGTHREGFAGSAVQWRAGIEYRAMHHVQARATDHHAQSRLGPIEPVLQHPGDARLRRNQVRHLVQHEWTPPTRALGFGGEAHQERVPVRILHVGKSGKPFGNRCGKVTALHGRSGLIGHGVQPLVAPRPLDEQA